MKKKGKYVTSTKQPLCKVLFNVQGPIKMRARVRPVKRYFRYAKMFDLMTVKTINL